MHTIGSLRTLKLVLINTGQPVLLVEAVHQAMKQRVPLAIDRLHAGRIIDVRDRGYRRSANALSLSMPTDFLVAGNRFPCAAPLEPARRAACKGCPPRDAFRNSRSHVLPQHDRREWPERLAKLDLRDSSRDCIVLLRASPRMLRAPSARGPNSMRALEPADDFLLRHQFGNFVAQLLVGLAGVELATDVGRVYGGTRRRKTPDPGANPCCPSSGGDARGRSSS